MRFRILLLFALGCLLGTPVLLRQQQKASACLNIPDAATCAQVFPDAWWVRPLGVLSLLVLGYAVYVLAVAWAERRHEKLLLDDMGVHVREEDLPLEE